MNVEMKGTQIERLTRIETLIEENVLKELQSIRKEMSSMKRTMDQDIADLAGLKHKGAGILIGISMAATAFGAAMASFWKHVVSFFS